MKTAEAVESPEQVFLTRAKKGQNVFLTGQAGTGKSWMLKTFLGVDHDPIEVAVTAPTGIAALNIGGQTIHRWAGMQLGPRPGEDHLECAQRLLRGPGIAAAKERINRARVLVIDEISMMSGTHFEFLNFWTRIVRESTAPFGGLQIICLGDFLQLPPVRTDSSKPYDWVFHSQAWDDADLTPVRLTTVRRQDDRDFITALSGFRLGGLSFSSRDLLKARVGRTPPPGTTRLFTHNVAVDRWNDYQLGVLKGAEFTLKARAQGPPAGVESALKNMSTPDVLQLKIGASVMFTANNPAQGFVNGQGGTVTGYDEYADVVTVFSRETEIRVKAHQWNFELLKTVVYQHPLRLAYAMTVHRAQGLTLNAAYMDITEAREPGQAYVALSRVRTLEGLYLRALPLTWPVSADALRFQEYTMR